VAILTGPDINARSTHPDIRRSTVVSKPELGRVAVGDRLLVIVPRYSSPYPVPTETDVTKVGRIWVEMEETGQARSFKRTWRLRLDTQDGGSSPSRFVERFVTAEQYAYEERLRTARAALFDAGISLNGNTPWRDDERSLALANFIRQHDGLDPL
jgi:hypothetical protein